MPEPTLLEVRNSEPKSRHLTLQQTCWKFPVGMLVEATCWTNLKWFGMVTGVNQANYVFVVGLKVVRGNTDDDGPVKSNVVSIEVFHHDNIKPVKL